MKIIRHLIAILLCAVITASALGFSSFASPYGDDVPLVILGGFTSSPLYLNAGTENQKRVWYPEVKDVLLSTLNATLRSAFARLTGDYDKDCGALARVVGTVFTGAFEYLRIEDDASSIYDVTYYPHAVEETTYASLQKSGLFFPAWEALKAFGSYTEEDNIYCCTVDFRRGQLAAAEVLRDYITQVKSLTGASKVRLFGESFGGQIVGTYLTKYGDESIESAVMYCPALEGTSLAPQILSGDDIRPELEAIIGYAASSGETDYSWIAKLLKLDFANQLLTDVVKNYIVDIFANFGCVWDFIPASDYEEIKALLLDGHPARRALADISDDYHYNIQPKYRERFAELEAKGVDISIVAGTGSPILTGVDVDSDGVIDTSLATGAEVLRAHNPGISECGHYHLSPDTRIDASCGYLPESTWYVEGMYHAVGFRDAAVGGLICRLLFSGGMTDVNSDPRFPQFIMSSNAQYGISAGFSCARGGFITPYSTELKVTNLISENISVESVKCSFDGLKFSYDAGALIPAGESADIVVSGTLPCAVTPVKIEIEYAVRSEKVTYIRQRSFYFTFAGFLPLAGDGSTGETITEGGATVIPDYSVSVILARIFRFIALIIDRLLALR